MNNKILLGMFVFMCIICNAIYAGNVPFGAAVKRSNSWMNPGAFDLSESLALTEQNIKEIKGVELQIKVITGYLQAIQEILGENFQDIGSTTLLKAAGLGQLKSLYSQLITNYKGIIRYFGATDHYYLPLSPEEYKELYRLLEFFAKKAGIVIKADDIRARAAASGG